jgi:hypothetical protein
MVIVRQLDSITSSCFGLGGTTVPAKQGVPPIFERAPVKKALSNMVNAFLTGISPSVYSVREYKAGFWQ